jgi:hypothetical protein
VLEFTPGHLDNSSFHLGQGTQREIGRSVKAPIPKGFLEDTMANPNQKPNQKDKEQQQQQDEQRRQQGGQPGKQQPGWRPDEGGQQQQSEEEKRRQQAGQGGGPQEGQKNQQDK